MSNHLKLKHPEKFMNLNKDKKNNDAATSLAEPVNACTSSSSTERQQTLSEAFDRKLLWDINNATAKKYHYLIAEMIALDNEPLCVVERVGFARLLKQALPRYELPSRAFMTQKIVPDIYNRIFKKIQIRISSAVAVSVTSDMWTCLRNNSSFLSFTAHWLSAEFKLQHGVLAMKPFSGSHTGENIANELNSIASRWDIEQSKIHVIVHDSGANMVKGVRMAEYNSARCFIHSLQRVVLESLKVQPEVMDLIAKGRRIVTHFNHSGLAKEKLLALQKELCLPEHQLVQDINTRWNSTFYMVERLLEQKRVISLYVSENDTLTNLTTRQWCLMEQCVQLLKPFEEITKITSSGLSCISEVIPHVAALKKFLDKDETVRRTADLLNMRASLKAQLASRFISLSEDPKYLIATFLDPRFKANFLGKVEAERARQTILLEHLKMTCDTSSISSCSSTSSTRPKQLRLNETDSNVARESHETFWDCFNEVADENNIQSRDHEKNPIATEIEFFLKEVRIDRSQDPYAWWSFNSKKYPILTSLAKTFLSAPCSSVYSERLFSEAGLVYENKRNRLLSANAENLVFIHHNLPLLNFEY